VGSINVGGADENTIEVAEARRKRDGMTNTRWNMGSPHTLKVNKLKANMKGR
jgi:hypothetical protein